MVIRKVKTSDKDSNFSLLQKLLSFVKMEVVVSIAALFVAGLSFCSQKNQTFISEMEAFRTALIRIAEIKKDPVLNNVATMSALSDQADRFIRKYPNEVSVGDLLYLGANTSFGFKNPKTIYWYQLALHKSEEQIPKDPILISMSKWYLASSYIINNTNLKEASNLYESALNNIKSEKSFRYKNAYFQIYFARAGDQYLAGNYDECKKILDSGIKNISGENLVGLDAKIINESIKNLNNCTPPTLQIQNSTQMKKMQ